MVVLRIVPTPMDHTLVAVILATALAVMDSPAMVLIIIIHLLVVYWTLNHRYRRVSRGNSSVYSNVYQYHWFLRVSV